MPQKIPSRKSTFLHLTTEWFYIAVIFGLISAVVPASAQDAATFKIDSLASHAYKLLETDPVAAEAVFLRIADMDPGNVIIKRQLGYIYYEKNDFPKAYFYFSSAESLSHSDAISLQMAYCLNSMGRSGESQEILKGLESSQEPGIRELAVRQQKEYSGIPEASRWWTRIYADPHYDTRWKSWFYFADFEHGYAFDVKRILNAYGFLNVSGDSRSESGLTPEIFSDNAVITGLGISIRPVRGLQFNAQYGLSYDFMERENESRVSGDFRSLIIYGNGIYPDLNFHDEIRIPLSLLLDVYSSVGYYSRYENFIGYLQGRAGARVFEIGYAAVDIYLRGSLARDTEKEFYNNLIDGSAGLRIIPNQNWGLFLAAEFHRGFYWDVGTAYNPYDQYFSGFRFFVIFEREF